MHLEHAELLLLTLVLVALMLNSCEPDKRLPSAGQIPAKSLPPSLKGYELYSWQSGHEWYYTLISGSNRVKTTQEILSGASAIQDDGVQVTVQGVHDIELTLEQLPSDARVVWLGRRAVKRRGSRPGALSLPPRRDVEDIQEHCRELGVRLEVVR